MQKPESMGADVQASPGVLLRRERGAGEPWVGTGLGSGVPGWWSGSVPSLAVPPQASPLPSLGLSRVSDKGKKEASSNCQPAGRPRTLCSCLRHYCQHLGPEWPNAISP